MFFNERQSTMFNNNNNYLNVFVDDKGNIFKTDFFGANPQQIGVTQEKYNEALKIANDFQNKLIELGVIEKEKTPEEIQKETNDLLKQMYTQFENINKRLETLENLENEKILRGEENEQHDYKKDVGNDNKQTKSKYK